MTQSEREAVIAEALSWEKTPYHDHGAVKGAGADCALMPLLVYRTALKRLPDIPLPAYVQQWHLHRNQELYLDYVRQLGGVELASPQPGDFALWKIGRVYSHGAIVLDWPHVIHAVNPSGVIRSDAVSHPLLYRREHLFFTL